MSKLTIEVKPIPKQTRPTRKSKYDILHELEVSAEVNGVLTGQSVLFSVAAGFSINSGQQRVYKMNKTTGKRFISRIEKVSGQPVGIRVWRVQ